MSTATGGWIVGWLVGRMADATFPVRLVEDFDVKLTEQMNAFPSTILICL